MYDGVSGSTMDVVTLLPPEPQPGEVATLRQLVTPLCVAEIVDPELPGRRANPCLEQR
jgi:hypothetical protein